MVTTTNVQVQQTATAQAAAARRIGVVGTDRARLAADSLSVGHLLPRRPFPDFRPGPRPQGPHASWRRTLPASPAMRMPGYPTSKRVNSKLSNSPCESRSERRATAAVA
jgi:hypothetical protein